MKNESIEAWHILRRTGRVYSTFQGTLDEARCRYCGAWVALNETPPPNGIDISGPAVATNCKR